jgi:hypothetical protein
MVNGKCTPPYFFIESASECERAAAALSLGITTATATRHVSYPHGCYTKGSSGLYINSEGGTAIGSAERLAICKKDWPYRKMTNGVCTGAYDFITSKSECSSAAAGMLLDTPANDGVGSTRPFGCYIKGSTLYFNLNGAKTVTSKSRLSICAYTPYRKMANQGFCSAPFESIASKPEREVAAAELDLGEETATEISQSTRPFGCYIKGSTLYFNTKGSTLLGYKNGKDDSRESICKHLWRSDEVDLREQKFGSKWRSTLS